MKTHACVSLVAAAATLTFSSLALAAGPVAQAPYKVTVFAKSVPGKYTQPDSIAVSLTMVYIGYQNGGAPDGSNGATSTIVEYTKTGQVNRTWTVTGHNDGLKINPDTHELWAMQNEDANPNLVIIATNTPGGAQRNYTFTGKTPHGGGYDDIVFRNGQVYFSASNPANNPNTAPAIVKATFSGSTISVTPFFAANTVVNDVNSDNPVTLNLQDPDSMSLDSRGDIILDSQADSELIVVRKPNTPQQSGTVIPLSCLSAPLRSTTRSSLRPSMGSFWSLTLPPTRCMRFPSLPLRLASPTPPPWQAQADSLAVSTLTRGS